MDGYAADVYFRFLDTYRAHVADLRAQAADRDRQVVEGWFQCLAFTGDEAFADDLQAARLARDEAETAHAGATAEVEHAERRLARLERTLQSLTTGPRPPA